MTRPTATMLIGGIAVAITLGTAGVLAARRHDKAEKRVYTVVPGRLIRGAWQNPDTLRKMIARERIKTVVTLTAINRDDPKYIEQSKVVSADGCGLGHRADERITRDNRAVGRRGGLIGG